MALFDEGSPEEPIAPRRWSRSTRTGLWALTVACIALLVMTFLPTAYVIQQPGPVYNTLGSAKDSENEDVALISVKDARTYPTSGALDLVTVQVVGNREQRVSWLQLALAWFDPARAVVPIDRIFPPGQSAEQRSAENAALMVDSQLEATAAALRELEYDVTEHVGVYQVVEGSAADGLLEPDDVILDVDGQQIDSVQRLQDIVAESEGEPVRFRILRGENEQVVSVTPRLVDVDGKQQWRIGVSLLGGYDFPVDVEIQLNDVGGPSAGMMFALGIVDTLTPGELNGGEHVAGTGTINGDGEVGPIGGIRQKLYGAQSAGAKYFLAPEDNCGEVVGHTPDGLRVFSVGDLDDALDVLEAVRGGNDLDALPACSTS